MGGQMGQMAHQMATSMATGNGVNINGQNISNKQMKEAVGRLSNDPKTQRRIQEANRANNTRDRLRAKLAAKQASQQSHFFLLKEIFLPLDSENYLARIYI